MATTPQEVWQLLGELIEAQKQTDLQFQETARRFRETDLKFQETDRKFQETNLNSQEADRRQQKIDQQIQELGKQIGGLGKKFGSFTEGLALPSMETILRQQFGMEFVSPSARVTREGKHIEIDVFAYANGQINKAIIVEVKSHAREESITQLVKQLERFHFFFPDHQNKQVYGILAAVDMSDDLREKALKAGLYVARIKDEVFELDTPADFQPRAW